MCTALLPPGVNPIAVNKHINIYQLLIYSFWSLFWRNFGFTYSYLRNFELYVPFRLCWSQLFLLMERKAQNIEARRYRPVLHAVWHSNETLHSGLGSSYREELHRFPEIRHKHIQSMWMNNWPSSSCFMLFYLPALLSFLLTTLCN